MIALEALAQSEFECPKNLSHGPPLEYEGSIGFKSSSSRSKKFCPSCYETLWTLTFFFFFYLFFLILYFFSFESLFIFIFSNDEEACDIAVT